MQSTREKVRAATAALSASLVMATMLVAASPAAPAGASTPSSCSSGTHPHTYYLSDFESADEGGTPSGWRAKKLFPQADLPTAEGQLGGSHWHYPAPAPGNQPWSGRRSIWADTFPAGLAPETAASSAIEMQKEVRLPAEARLSFIHRFDFTAERVIAEGLESVNDFGAGTVEFSVNGGPWHDSRTFTGKVSGHRSSHFNLSGMAGKSLRLRFLLTTLTPPPGLKPAAAGEFRGWAIDDVHIYTCESAPPKKGDDPGTGTDALPQHSLRSSPVELRVMRRPRALRPGMKAILRVAVTNRLQTPLRRVRVCFRAPRRILTGPRCAMIRRLPARAAANLELQVQVASNPPKRRKRVRASFFARANGKLLIVASRRFKLLSD